LNDFAAIDWNLRANSSDIADRADANGNMLSRLIKCVLLLSAALAGPAQLRAQTSGFAAERMPEVEIRSTEATNPILPTPAPAAAAGMPASALNAGWDNGFFLRSADDQFQLRITGQIQIDDREYQNNRDTTDMPTFLIRRARLGIEANVAQYYEFRFMPDFGNGTTRIQDSYLNLHYWDEWQFEAGKFKQPFSLEQLIQDRYVPTIERSLIDQLGPQRDVGAMIHGQRLFNDILDYGLSLYGGVQNGDSDNDRNREGAARIAVRPLRNFGIEAVSGMQLGVAGTIGEDDGVLSPNILRTPASVPWFVYADKVRPDGLRQRLSPEFAWIYGPAALAAQYYWESDVLLAPAVGKAPAADVTLNARGGYVMGLLLVTGEQRTSLSQAIEPLTPFDPVGGIFGIGAIELVGRVSRLEMSTDNAASFDRLVVLSRTAPHATELTLGFNWYLNRFVRFQFNWEYARFANPIRLGDPATGNLDHQNSFLTRFQIVF
jgi:phosphate-selective porin OprO and OprP